MPVYVKYNRMLHGKKTSRQEKHTLTIQFLKTYIHYAKNRIHPELTDEVIYRKLNQFHDSIITFMCTTYLFFSIGISILKSSEG